MEFKYIITYSNGAKTIKTIKLNGGYLFWATMMCNPTLSNKSNIWLSAKRFIKQTAWTPYRQSMLTRIFTFMAFNKEYNVQQIFIGRFRPRKHLYLCTTLPSNDFHNFIIYLNSNNKQSNLNLIKRLYGVQSGINKFYISCYERSINTVFIDDPENIQEIINMEQVFEEHDIVLSRIIEDLKKLNPKEECINGENYCVVQLDESIKIGLSKKFMDMNPKKRFENGVTLFDNFLFESGEDFEDFLV